MKINTTYQNLWYVAKAYLREKFIRLNVYIREERSQINDLSSHLTKLNKEGQMKPNEAAEK